ncbi:MAG: type II toxin-antitoxin system HicA family toxin [Thermodesulfovibrio sp.]
MKFPAVTGKHFVKFLESIGFKVICTKGSHVRLKAENSKASPSK